MPRNMKKSISRAKIKIIDAKYMGTEPVWSDKEATNLSIMTAFSWYNYMTERKDTLDLFYNHYNRDKKDLKHIRKVEHLITPSVCYQLRMIALGCKMPKDYLDRLNYKIDEYIRMGKAIKEEPKTVKAPTNVISIQDKIREKTSDLIAEIEEEIDTFYNNDCCSDFNMYSWLQSNQVKSVHAAAIAKHYEPLLEELRELKTKKSEDLNYAYGAMKPADVKRYLGFVETIVNDATTWGSNQKTVRKARKKKPVSVEKQTSKVQYLKEHKEYKLVSVNPSQVIGANQLWAFNVKYRRLTRYDAQGPAGLSFKGTTLQGWDESLSVCKAIRKPEQVLPSVTEGGKITLRKLMETLKTKVIAPNGRINKDTILLKVVR